jgi:hypothetical protein
VSAEESDLRQPTLTVGVDPGRSVGVAALLNQNRFRVHQFRIDGAGGLEQVDACLNELFVIALERDYRLLVGCEKFVTNRRTARLTNQPDALTVVGRVSTLSPVEVHLQAVADATRFVSNERLRAFNLWTTPAMVGQPDADDVNSAMRHAVLLLARKAATQYAKLVDLASTS